MSEKSNTFAHEIEDDEGCCFAYTDFRDYDDDDDEPTALATDVGKNIPILEGEAAERFIRIMEENNKKTEKRAKRKMTKEEAENALHYKRMFLKMKEDEIIQEKKDIKELEDYINSFN